MAVFAFVLGIAYVIMGLTCAIMAVNRLVGYGKFKEHYMLIAIFVIGGFILVALSLFGIFFG